MSDPISPVGSLGQLPMASGASPTLALARAGLNDVQPQMAPPATGASAAQPIETLKGSREPLPTPAPAKSQVGEKPPPNLEESVAEMREYLKNLPTNLEVRADEETGNLIFKVVNPVTKEVIRQYPPDELVALARRMRSLANKDVSGILLDRRL